jgi:hypothetical protein
MDDRFKPLLLRPSTCRGAALDDEAAAVHDANAVLAMAST